MGHYYHQALEELPVSSPSQATPPSPPPEGGEKLIKLEGPLSEIYAKAIAAVYTKDPEEHQVLESEQQEVSIMQRLVSDLVEDPSVSEGNPLAIYAVSYDEDKDEEIAKARLSMATAKEPENTVMVIKEDPKGQATEAIESLKAFCNRRGIRTYPSLEAYVNSRH